MFAFLSQLVRAHRIAAPLLGVILIVASAHACNVPVFRFALERWRADAYRVTVFHEGELSAADKEALTQLEEQQEKSRANVQVRTIDVAKLEPADQELLKALPQAKFPWLTVQYPAALQIEAPIWSQPFSAVASSQLLDSPLRKETLNRLVDGETAVWLLLECGDAEKDNAAAALLQEQLIKLAKELQLPELTDLPDDNLVAKTPLKLSFSMLRVPRGDAEAALVQMLVHSEPDLLERNDPMIFPVFGRGRASLPLIGAGITADNIKNSATFLVGACSCEVKELNPGFDILLKADWDELLSANGEPLPIVKTRNLPMGEPELVAIPKGSAASVAAATTKTETTATSTSTSPTAPPTQSSSAVYTIIAIAGAFAVFVVLLNFNKSKTTTH
jgi:hypothetical protein